MDTIFIFGAKYLFILSPAIFVWSFYKLNNASRKQLIWLSIGTFALAFIIAVCLRHLYFNPRPFVVGGFTPLIPHAPDNGFPSDHVLLVSAIASIMLYYNKKQAAALWAITLLVAISRVYVGVHHSLDVVASILIALISSNIVYIGLKTKRSDIISK